MPTQSARRRIPALDGVRGFAVAAVLLFHGGHLQGGFLGIDLFFVLSGFLITSLLLAESERRARVGLAAFWTRRARRLLPALLMMLGGVALYSVVFADASELDSIRRDAFSTIGYFANWRAMFATQDYWALFTRPSPLQHTWSLAIEEQFYIIWPLVFVAVLAWSRRAVPRTIFRICVIGAVVSAVLLAVLYDPNNSSRAYYGTDTRATAILIGAALAAALSAWGTLRGRSARLVLEVLGATGIVVLAYAWTSLDGQTEWLFRGGLFVFSLSAVAIIAALVHPTPGPLSRLLAWRPMCLLGLISYGVYLWHWPVYVVLDEQRTGLTEWPLLVTRITVTILIAVTSFLLVERPIHLGSGSPRTFWVAMSVATAFTAGVIMLATVGGTSSRFATPKDSADTNQPRRAGVSRVLVTGDSVAMTLTPGLQDAAKAAGLEIISEAAEGCAPDGNPKMPDVAKSWTANSGAIEQRRDHPCETMSQLLDRWHPDVVLAIDSGVWSLKDGLETFRFKTQQIVAEIPAGSLHVWTTLACVRPNDSQASATFARALRDGSDVLRDLATSASDRVRLVDLAAFVCPQGKYHESLGGVSVLRPDGLHYGPEGSELVGAWIAQQIRDILDAASRTTVESEAVSQQGQG